MINQQKVEKLIRRFEKLKSERVNWDTSCQEIAKFCLPKMAQFTDTLTEGQKFDTTVYNSVASEAINIMASGLYSYAINPATQWIQISQDELIEKQFPESKELCYVISQLISTEFLNSNFYDEAFASLLSYSTFEMLCNYTEDKITEIRFQSVPINQVYFTETADGKLNSIYRLYMLTVEQIYDEFGDKSGNTVLAKYKAGDYDVQLPILTCCEYRSVKNESKSDKLNMPIAEYWINKQDKTLMEEGGYKEMPYQLARGKRRAGHKYPFSSAGIALADIKMLNSMDFSLIVGSQKALDPTLLINAGTEEFENPFRNLPGYINYINTTNPNFTSRRILETVPVGNLPIGIEMLDRKEARIKSILLVDMFLAMLSKQKQMTATEVVQLTQEKQFILAPFINSINSYFLDPTIERVFNILYRRGSLPSLPDWFMSYKINYVSPLALAAKLTQTRGINEYLSSVERMSQIQLAQAPVTDNIDFDKMNSLVADINNIKPSLIKNLQEVQRTRAQIQQLQQQQQILQMAQQGAGAYKDAMQGEQAIAKAF